MVTAIDLQNGTALFRNRFVRTDVFTKERRLQRIVSRGAFNTPKTGGFFANFLNLRTRDVANTNVLYWAGRLLTLFESTSPHKIEPDSLRTISKSTLGRILKPGQPFSAHPRVDANTGRLINFSSQPRGLSSTDLTVFEFDAQFNVVQQRYAVSY
jgi:all-trans-8'-apo-beta-carotenal 15,15'-oxygenase